MFGRIKQISWGALFGCLIATQALGQATLLPNAKQQFFTAQGIPAASGTVDMYVPSTNTRKTTWKGSSETVGNQNTNPVLLDAGGFAQIYGDGQYRQVVKDADGNTIWDALTASTGGGGSSSTPTVGDGNIVGTILPWSGFVAPPNYVFTYGQPISRTTYPLFFATVTYTVNLVCTSGLNVLSGISDTSQIRVGSPVEASCIAPGTVVTAVAPTSVTISTNASVSTAISAVFLPFGNGDGSTTFNVPELRGAVLAGRNNMGGTPSLALSELYFGPQGPNSLGASGGNSFSVLSTPNLAPYTPAGTIANGAITNTVTGGTKGAIAGTTAVAAAGHAFADVGSDIVVTSAQATSTFAGSPQGGTSLPFSRVQPTVTVNYIVKIAPDVSAAVATGVASLGGMTGVLACGTGLLCSAQTVSVAPASGIPASAVTFTQQGTGAVQVGQDLIDNRFLFPEEFGAVGDGVALDRAAIQLWVDAGASFGKELAVYPGTKYRLTENGTNCYSILISSTVQIRGMGGSAGAPKGWFFTDPGVRSCVDTFRIRASSANAANNTAFENVRIGNGTTAVGNSQIYIDTTGGGHTVGYAKFLNLQLEATASGWVVYHDNSDGVDLTGGMFLSTIRDGNYHGGVNYVLTGSGHVMDHVYVNTVSTSGYSVRYSQIAGGAPSTFINNIFADGAGPVQFRSGRGVIFTNNSVESSGTLTGSNGAVADFAGDLSTLVSPTISGNYFGNLSSSASAIYSLRVGSALDATIGEGNNYTTTNVTQANSGYWIADGGTQTTIAHQGYQAGGITSEARNVNRTGTLISAIAYANRREIVDVNYTAVASDRTVAYTTLSAARVVSLPPAASFNPGDALCIRDDSGNATTVLTISAAPNGTDRIQGSNTTQIVVNQAQGLACLESNGTNGWLIPLTFISGDATGSVSQGGTLPLTVSKIGGKAVTLGGAFTMSGAFSFTGTVTGNTSVTFPTSGILATTSGSSIPAVATGDILYGSAANTLSALADVATGNALISGGVGVAPAWGKIGISTHVSGLGTGIATALGVNVGTAGAPVINGGALGTPSSGTLTSATGLPISTGLTGAGTGVLTALGINVGSAGALVTFNGALGTPSSGVATNLTGTAASLTAGNVTTNANLTGPITSVGNATSIASQTGTGTTFVMSAGPTLTGVLTAPTHAGGSAAGSTLTLESTSGAGTTDSIAFQTASQVYRGGISTGGLWTIGPNVTPNTGVLLTINSNTVALPAPTFSSTLFQIGGADSVAPRVVIDSFASNGSVSFRRANGTGASPSQVLSGQILGGFFFEGRDTAGYNASDAATIFGAAAETFTTTAHGTRITVNPIPTGSLVSAVSTTFNASGAVWIGTTNIDKGQNNLGVQGQVYIPNITADTATADSTVCSKTSDGQLLKGTGTLGICLGTSSARYKQDVAPMGAGLAEIVQLVPKNFFYKKGWGDDNKRLQYGLIAEDVVKVLPGITSADSGGKPNSVDLLALVPVLINAVKQLKADNDNLRMDMLALQTKGKTK